MMLVLVTYDVSTLDRDGQRRLRQVAKICQNFGQRVQNSVFECWLSNENLVNLRQQLLQTMDSSQDSVRFYSLGKNWEYRVEHYGIKPSINPEDPLII